MELKDYQRKTVEQVASFLEALSAQKAKCDKAVGIDPDMAFDYAAKAWGKVKGENASYVPKKNGLGECLADFYIKLPTGGGKTLLACHIIESINRTYLKKRTGIVLWIVPTNQIYKQTFLALKDRNHPYRQVLDIASGGRTVLLEKTDKFTSLDVSENLVVMLLMLPSASRQNKETLRVFRDSGGFTEFFPPEDHREKQEELLKRFPNLDFFGGKDGFFGRTVKTSLGNVLRVLKPMVLIDEGHKAYSEIAQNTIRGFNPSIVLELSATPPERSNVLVRIGGQDLNKEDMIKLDLHVTNKATGDWKDVLRCAFDKRLILEKKAKDYEAATGQFINPLCLIQVERTGKDQKTKGFIHADDVKEHLIEKYGIPNEEIAIKSSEKDDIEGIDLLSRDNIIRFIITKHALQEGWDCPFAYILVVLTNPSSQVSITQLVGRILRQPYAKKTRIPELDESYVYCFRQRARDILENVRDGFRQEGLEDLTGRIISDRLDGSSSEDARIEKVGYRKEFKKFEGKIYLPLFAVKRNGEWSEVNYEMDLLSKVDWSKADLSPLNVLALSEVQAADQVISMGFEDGVDGLTEKSRVTYRGGIELSDVFVTRQIFEIVPNPWIAHQIGRAALGMFLKKYDEKIVKGNFVYIIEELRKQLLKERDRLCEQVFRQAVKDKSIYFYLLSAKGSYMLPSSVDVLITPDYRKLPRSDNSQLQRSLFEYESEENYNDMEKAIAVYLDDQERLLWWYRNLVKKDSYHVQGWKRGKIYPDFVFSEKDTKEKEDYCKVYVVETKGTHLKNEDTDYKKDVFRFCTEIGKEKDWQEIHKEFSNKRIEFQVIFEEEWKARINEIFGMKR